MGSQMDSESVKKLANELDISGCGSVNLEVCTFPAPSPSVAPHGSLWQRLMLGAPSLHRNAHHVAPLLALWKLLHTSERTRA